MSMLATAGRSNPAIFCSAAGVSEDSRMIREILGKFLAERRRPVSFAWRDSLLDEVWTIRQTCLNEGWDGYEAEPVSRESAFCATQLINLLPEGIQIPSVVPEPTGDLSLEWLTEDQKHFTLGISGPTLVFAGIFGGSSKRYGEERFFRVLPQEILDILTDYFSQA